MSTNLCGLQSNVSQVLRLRFCQHGGLAWQGHMKHATTSALKSFYAEEVTKHKDFKTEKSGLFIFQQKPFIATSPDGFMTCKCHGKFAH